MSIFERLFAPFRREPAENASQAQREALLDLLVLTMYADHHLALAEQDMLDAQGAELEWTSVVALRDFLAESVVRARDVIDGRREVEDYLGDMAERLADRDHKHAALMASRELMGADGRLREEEIRLVKAAERVFGSGL